MARYIDINEIKFTGAVFEDRDGEIYIKLSDVKQSIEQTPTADVVEVIRCKDCDVPHNKWTGCPNLNGFIPPSDFYCAKGTPKERGLKK
ncbi:MAG: hypothetical protein IJE10_11305 [Clostridia bacterium]|nr:hypothetical protein [Clostridia bacterium]